VAVGEQRPLALQPAEAAVGEQLAPADQVVAAHLVEDEHDQQARPFGPFGRGRPERGQDQETRD
jgi:hypothetical protein